MKTAVVTGASSGMGREFVRQIGYFYRDLDEIWVIARRKERLERLAENSRVQVRIFDGDLRKKPVYRKLYTALKEEHPDIRMLVNGAGFGKSGTVEKIAGEDPKIQTDMVDLNCRALTRMTLMCLPYMSAGSRIINLASAAAFCPQPSFAVYAATKSYVLSFSRGLGAELQKRGICVTAVCPGPVDTEFFTVSGALNSPLKKLTMAKAPQVVHQALKDSRKRKALSVFGLPMKAVHVGTKLIPHGLILKIEERLSE
ncbi:short-chain dehydrogenase [Lachnoclostridium sp. An169]|uniref:SDR family NAD(P)-dependent oxidoreductase n=1 Tax=Lachnoclostridium sp. An169 TaxID=1965569 RepID=UPI000B3A47CE|nr:SDR family NAD(P)-dependent oxidoreductase [Lachnoclostridium sp. An169]OUP83045.1 short-chain dehydrogenase [Lachnoclostridium sp. An169]